MLHSRQDVCIAERADETGAEDHIPLIQTHTQFYMYVSDKYRLALKIDYLNKHLRT